MGKIPTELRAVIARNIRECRMKKFPHRGGGKKCAEEFGVTPQQWSPWERGTRTPDEKRLEKIARFFGVTTEFILQDHQQKIDCRTPGQPSGEYPHTLQSDQPGTTSTKTRYVPVFVVLPDIPEDMRELFKRFDSLFNGD